MGNYTLINAVVTDCRKGDAMHLRTDEIFKALEQGIENYTMKDMGNSIAMEQDHNNPHVGYFYQSPRDDAPASEWIYLGLIMFQIRFHQK